MKVLFICGSAQPQRCGVGDYSRKLAGEFIRLGHEACIVSLMDADVASTIVESQIDGNIAVTVIRLPYINGYKQNCIDARTFVDDFAPDWISLQYVPFSFHPKGLPVGLSGHLKLLTNSRHVQIMFHELWVGINRYVDLKLKVWGQMQQKLILSLVKNLKPEFVHTQTTLYLNMLSSQGVPARLLPLFSNIPTEFTRNGNGKLRNNSKENISLVLFGSIHPNAPVQEFASELLDYVGKAVKKISLTILGRAGKEAKNWEEVFKKSKIDVTITGEQSEENISRILSKADYGITTSDFDLLEKSGSVVAMVEHGLDVICVSNGYESYYNHQFIDIQRLYNYKPGNLADFFNTRSDQPSKTFFSTVKETSLTLLHTFEETERHH